MKKFLSLLPALLLLVLTVAGVMLLTGCSEELNADITLVNASYDPTREFYEAYNRLFAAEWKAETGQTVEIVQSHAGSGSQALAVANGLPADVVTLALEADISSIEAAGLIEAGWQDEFACDSAPYTSTIVFLVRGGNPLGLHDWGDLVTDGVEIVTPSPKTSGAARWIFLAAWAWAEREFDADEQAILNYMTELYRHVIVLSSGARGATTVFCESGQGDVLLSWENEACLTAEAYPDDYELVCPGITMLCQPSVAIVDEVAGYHHTQEAAAAYLQRLYSPEAQRLAAEYYYRPSDAQILAEYSERFDLSAESVTIEHFGGWRQAQQRFFADGGVFDLIYE